MRRKVLIASALICMVLTANAQVGVNTTTPKTTMEITSTTDPNLADGVLVPRVTVTELNNKESKYGSDQNGTLVFVTNTSGATGKTADVTALGFYYYDNGTSKWKAVGGSGATPGNAPLNVIEKTDASYTATATDDIILYANTVVGTKLTLPTTGVTIGKKIYVSVIGTENVELSPLPRETSTQFMIPGFGVTLMYTGNITSPWSIVSGF